MAITIDWATGVINVPQADLTLVTGTLYELDTNAFRLSLKALEASVDGMAFVRTHIHNTPVTVAGTTFARTFEIINGYSVQFENLTYSVRLSGSNNNIFDVENGILVQNNVQVIAQNSAGLVVTGITGLTTQESTDLANIRKNLENKMVTDPATGVQTSFEDDGTTPRKTWQLWEDFAELQKYRSQGAEVRDPLP